MLDSYRRHGPVLATPGRRPLCFGVPYDGRSRTAPLLPLVALLLASDGLPVVLHGGGSMPVKFGVDPGGTLRGARHRLARPAAGARCRSGSSVTAWPSPTSRTTFPLAERLVPVRDAIGKRPPVASLELLWTPHRGEHLLVSGFVHPPTETRAWEALQTCGETDVLTVKGLEGSTDLPTSRAGITARVRQGVVAADPAPPPRPRHHRRRGAPGRAWTVWRAQALAALCGDGPLAPALRWNVAAYLWFGGRFERLDDALDAGVGPAAGPQRRAAAAGWRHERHPFLLARGRPRAPEGRWGAGRRPPSGNADQPEIGSNGHPAPSRVIFLTLVGQPERQQQGFIDRHGALRCGARPEFRQVTARHSLLTHLLRFRNPAPMSSLSRRRF